MTRVPELFVRNIFGSVAASSWSELLHGLDKLSVQVIPAGTTARLVGTAAMPVYLEQAGQDRFQPDHRYGQQKSSSLYSIETNLRGVGCPYLSHVKFLNFQVHFLTNYI